MKLLEKRSEENARSYAFRVLLENIISLELPPGTAVSEKELSLQMNLSRTPVREALIELAKSNLVEILPQRGSYIAKIDYKLIEEMRFLRLATENAVIEEACMKGFPDSFLQKLKDNVAEQHFVINGPPSNIPVAMMKLDDSFHRTIFEAAGKERIYQVIHQQMYQVDRLRSLTVRLIKNDVVMNDHENLIYALERRDGELAKMIMTKHLTRYVDEKEEICQRYPEYIL